MSLDGRLRVAYLRPATARSWSPEQLDTWVRAVVDSGLNAVAVKAPYVTPALAESCAAHGAALIASMTCFSDHDGDPVDRSLWPIDEHGDEFPLHVWYRGVIPTDDRYNDEVLERVAAAAALDGVSGVILDFIRWPVHWETELRSSSPRPPRGSYDPITLRRFRRWLDDRGADGSGIDVADAAASARTIDATLWSEWVEFRCRVITDLVGAIAERIHAAGRWVAVFSVPVAERERIEIVGQDTAALGECVDAVFPMTYHGIMHERPQWASTMAADVQNTTAVPVLPAVQLTADAEYSAGNDWGPSIDVDECVSLAADLDERFGGFFVFPGDALDGARITGLAATLPAR